VAVPAKVALEAAEGSADLEAADRDLEVVADSVVQAGDSVALVPAEDLAGRGAEVRDLEAGVASAALAAAGAQLRDLVALAGQALEEELEFLT
jgi:hypothetical protein